MVWRLEEGVKDEEIVIFKRQFIVMAIVTSYFVQSLCTYWSSSPAYSGRNTVLQRVRPDLLLNPDRFSLAFVDDVTDQ